MRRPSGTAIENRKSRIESSPTLRSELLDAARRAAPLLPEGPRPVIGFLRGQRNADGGFRGRGPQSDLYYTVFAADSLAAIGARCDPESLAAYLSCFGAVESLDFVHHACFARTWAGLPPDRLPLDARTRILDRIEAHRTADGGYNPVPLADHGSAYGCYLALGAYEDLGAKLPNPDGVVQCLCALQTDDSAFANEPDFPIGSTPATAATLTILRHLGETVDQSALDWLLAQADPQGGFRAMVAAPIPDLLSTATALHALAAAGIPLGARLAPCLDFVLSLYTPQGAFRGSWLDDALDCEYTYYGLLALGHLGKGRNLNL